MAVLASPIPGHSGPGLGLLAIVLLAALAAVGYFFGREYVGRRGPGHEQFLRDWFVLALAILGVIVLVGRHWGK